MCKILIKSFLVILIFFLHFNIGYATSGGVDASGCHNSSEGYHCHNNGDETDTGSNDTKEDSVIELSDNVQTGETYNNIIRKLKEKRSCSRIYSTNERRYCYDILREGDIYSKGEVLSKLKEKKNCNFFYSLYSDKNECAHLIKTENVYSIEEMKKETYNFSRCSKIRKFKIDYVLCKTELENKLKNEEKLKKQEARQLVFDAKFEKVKEKLNILYEKSPRKIQKLQLQIFDVLPKLKEGTTKYLFIKKMDEYLKILVWVDYK